MGLIGNCAFVALIRPDTSVVWLCWPRLDSSSVFGDLLDPARGGTFAMASADGPAARTNQYYHEIGSPHLDASTLQLITMGYLAPTS